MTDQNLPSDEAVREFRALVMPTGARVPPAAFKAIVRAYLTSTDEGRALVTDAWRLRQFETWANAGGCPALVNDDNGHWSVAFDGIQDMPLSEGPEDVNTSFYIEAGNWHDSVAAAIDAAIARQEGEGNG